MEWLRDLKWGINVWIKALTIIQLAIKSYVDEDGGALAGQKFERVGK